MKQLKKQAMFSAINWSPIVKGLALGISHGPNVIVITKVTLNAEHYFIALSAHIFCPDFLFAQKTNWRAKLVWIKVIKNRLFQIKCLLRKVCNSIQPFANTVRPWGARFLENEKNLCSSNLCNLSYLIGSSKSVHLKVFST